MKAFKSEYAESVLADKKGREIVKSLLEPKKEVYLTVYDSLESLLLDYRYLDDTEKSKRLKELGFYTVIDTKKIQMLSCVGDDVEKFKGWSFDSVLFDEQGSFKGDVINYLIKERKIG
jgi:hypothetical protein